MNADEISSPLPANLYAEVILTPLPPPPTLDSNPHGELKQKEAVPNDSGAQRSAQLPTL